MPRGSGHVRGAHTLRETRMRRAETHVRRDTHAPSSDTPPRTLGERRRRAETHERWERKGAEQRHTRLERWEREGAEQRHTHLDRWERDAEKRHADVKELRVHTRCEYTHAARCEGAASAHTLRDAKELRVHTRCEMSSMRYNFVLELSPATN